MVKVSKTFRLVLILLLIPIIPFAVLGWWFEPWIASFSQSLTDTWSVAAAVVALLAVDIFLPVPSSVVSTVAGQQLGILAGSFFSMVGMTIGSLAGFLLAAKWGRRLAERYSDEDSLRRMDSWHQRYSTTFLILSRPLPIFAEAAVLFCGMNRVPLRKFLPPVLICNSALSVAYAALGKYSASQSWFPAALVLAAGAPLLVAELVRRRA